MFNNLSIHSCVSLARNKLHGAASHGARDDIRLCRWVLLKNSLSSALSRSTESVPESGISTTPTTHVNPEQISSAGEIPDEEEIESFLFPDGDVFAESFDASRNLYSSRPLTKEELSSEADWFDSLLESLSADPDADALVHIAPNGSAEEEDEDSDLASLLDSPSSSEDLTSPTALSPASYVLPPSPPLVAYALPMTEHHHLYPGSSPITYPDEGIGEMDIFAPPDVIEDSLSDSDSESLNTLFTRSVSSQQEGNVMRGPFVHIVNHESQIYPSEPQYHPFEFGDITPDSFEQEC